MDYVLQLTLEHSKLSTDRIAKAIGDDAKEFKKLIHIIYNSPAPLPHRASWLLAVISRKHPELIKPYVKKFVDTVKDLKPDGIKRNVMQALASQKIPEAYRSKLLDISYELMLASKEPVAVKVWAMEAAANIIVLHPELKSELLLIIEDQIGKNSVAFSARARQVIKRINGASSKE